MQLPPRTEREVFDADDLFMQVWVGEELPRLERRVEETTRVGFRPHALTVPDALGWQVFGGA